MAVLRRGGAVSAGWSQLRELYEQAQGIVGPDGDAYVLLALRLGRRRPEDAVGRAYLDSARSGPGHDDGPGARRPGDERPGPREGRVRRRRIR
jgi:hypothetical protein